jgi:FeS assembly SUF system protein
MTAIDEKMLEELQGPDYADRKANNEAHQEMLRKSMDDEEFQEFAMPSNAEVPLDHPMWPAIDKALRDVYDPEIPVNIFELGLIYKVDLSEGHDGDIDIFVEMTLTSPGCPVAGEMPGMVQSAIFPVKGVGAVDVDLVFDPPWDPSMMAETAKLQLNMFT